MKTITSFSRTQTTGKERQENIAQVQLVKTGLLSSMKHAVRNGLTFRPNVCRAVVSKSMKNATTRYRSHIGFQWLAGRLIGRHHLLHTLDKR